MSSVIKEPVKALTLTRKVKKGKVEFKMEFTIDGEVVTYDKISTEEKYQFVQALQQSLGTLANVVLAEMKGKED